MKNMDHVRFIAVVAVMLVMTVVFSPSASSAGDEFGVYEYVVRNAEGTVDDIAAAIDKSAVDAGWTVSAIVDAGRLKDCSFEAKVLVLYHPEYAAGIMNANRHTGPYAALDRVSVFQDENGTHVSVVNPRSINRTILMDDAGHSESSESHLQALRTMILLSVKGTESSDQYGQMRSEGFIGKTMGVVAGGKFEGLIQKKAAEKGTSLEDVAARVEKGMSKESKKWGLKLAYRVDIPAFDVIILGTSGSSIDTKSFKIVGTGGDEFRKDFEYPGLSHAAAYPVEIVISKDGEEVKVEMIEAMFRMKMYFEDAGKIAFMKNMKMPGSIDKELKKQIRDGLKGK
ncbi:MAG: hypothetical protein KOO63_06670 [Bacteroidales bacterium]|nr:hypothetical protein [Candidatus Latescibacterota bacterium]